MAGREILEARLDTLLDDLEKVKTAVATASAGRRHILEAIESLQRARRQIKAIASVGREVDEELRQDAFGALEAAQQNEILFFGLRGLPAKSREAAEHVEAVIRLLQPISERMVAIEGQGALKSALHGDCTKLAGKVKDSRRALDEHPADLASHWARYLEFVDREARPLFDAYVDFISGLAVRDNDLDGSICAISDRLVDGLLGTNAALSLPAREAALSMDAIVKLGFPEWGIWSVPLAAREAGASIVRHAGQRTMLSQVLADPPGGLPIMETRRLVEDAIGAYTLGPAYARAMFTFRLRPGWRPGPDLPADNRRAEVILQVLTLQHDPDDHDDFADEVTSLRHFWERAVADLSAEPADRLDPAFTKAVHEVLSGDWRLRGFAAGQWDSVVAWRDHLLRRRGSEDEPPVEEVDRVATLLNAGWLARSAAPGLESDLGEELMVLLRRSGTTSAATRAVHAPLPADRRGRDWR
ncbi:hypothetical protein [Nonomuraea sp. NPDC050310]|uniref:hypothetical protein n=1 Tax=unclassified Nonomuraea TaxID=2593643 RepID=UPI0033FF945F